MHNSQSDEDSCDGEYTSFSPCQPSLFEQADDSSPARLQSETEYTGLNQTVNLENILILIINKKSMWAVVIVLLPKKIYFKHFKNNQYYRVHQVPDS